MKPETALLHPIHAPKDQYGANSFPIYQTSTFAQPFADCNGPYDYSRSGNPTRDYLQAALAELDQAKYAFTFNTGMAAISAICRILKPGDEILSNADIYGGTHRYFTQILDQLGIHVKLLASTEISEIENEITPRTRLIWIETPSNPFQRVTDIEAISTLKSKYDLYICVDNTTASSWIQKPLLHGADLSIQSATKYLSGHSDVSAGLVTTNDPKLGKHLSFIQNAEGSALAPFESWLLYRGLETLSLRFEKQQLNTMKVAEYLLNQSLIKHVHYTGLASHKHHHIHSKQSSGSGSVLSFETGDKKISKAIVESTKLFNISVSFGSVKSSISLPFYMSHASISEHQRDVPSDLIRISVGIEHIEDLIADLQQAFQQASLLTTATHAQDKENLHNSTLLQKNKNHA